MERQSKSGLFSIAGVPVRIHFTWIFVAVYLTWLFSGEFRQLARAAEIANEKILISPWVWGIIMTLALFAGVLLHELAHVVVARRGGARVHSITLMMLGGVSEIGDVDRPRLERRMAAAGPLVSLGLALVFYLLFRLSLHGPPDVRFGLFYLAQANLVIGVFNLLPAFPMDGGRVLRSLLQGRLGRLRATQVAALVGKIFAVGMVVVGLLSGSWWLMLIAMFLFIGGDAEARAVEMRAALRGLRVADVFSRSLATVDGGATAAQAASAMLTARSELCIVLSSGEAIGMLTSETLAAVPVRERDSLPVARLIQGVVVVRADDELPSVLRMLDEERLEAVAVTDGERLVGTLRREDIARGLQLRELAVGRS